MTATDHNRSGGIAPVVDIGIPTHGAPPYLAETVESVLGQTFTSWRLTVSENGPGGAEIDAIMQPYLEDPRVRLVRTGEDRGAAHNAASLVSAASATYVALLHDDDCWDPEFLERRVDFLDRHPSCGLVFSGCRIIDSAGGEVFRSPVLLAAGVQPRHDFLRTLYRHNIVYMPTVLVRRQAYQELGSFSEAVLFYDYEMWLRIASRFDAGYLPVWDAAYRVHPRQTTHEVSSRLGEHRLQLLEAVEPYLPDAISRFERQRARAAALLHASVDALGRHELGPACDAFIHALRAYPAVVVDPSVIRMAAQALHRRSVVGKAWRRSGSPD
jgi:glycosyltransferase involved in cell wall biosynthesis